MPNEVVNNNLLTAFNLHLKNEFQSALNIYSSILKVEPENIYANHFLGILLIQNGYFDQGLGHVHKSINTDHSFASASEYNLKLFSSSIEAKYTQDFDFFVANEPYAKRSPGTVDDWRHLRMLEFTSCFNHLDLTWLTIGDHYAHDAMRIKNHGNKNVIPTSLNTSQLQNAKKIRLD